jgi:hypothetical protein
VKRRGSTVLLLLSIACLTALAGSAVGAARTLSIKGNRRVSTGQSTQLTFSGRTAKRRGLAVYLDGSRCARRVVAEEARARSRQWVVRAVRGRFRQTVTVQHSSAGTHYICAYLYHGKGRGFVTDAHASFHYVTA